MKIILSRVALTDLKQIKDFISKNSLYYADVFTKKLTNSIRKLIDFPNIGRIVPEYDNINIKEIIYQNYRIIYKIKDNSIIYVISIIHGARDLTSNINLLGIEDQ